MRLKHAASAVLLALGLALAPKVEATSAIFLELDDHASRSTAVVRATVGSQRVALHSTWGRPVTLTKIEVREVLFGEAPASFEVEQIGGAWGDEVLYVAGDARLKPGTDVVLFVNQGPEVWYLTAMEQSHYQVVPSVDGPALERDLTSGLFLRMPDGSMKAFEPRDEAGLTLADLKAELKDLDGRGGAR